MNLQDKITWMETWCKEQGLILTLEGECGFGRECVGVLSSGCYPDYAWYDKDYNQIDNNGEVWCPEGAYHKHPCVAVLGRSEASIEQLYEWLKWFSDNNFKYVCEIVVCNDPLELMLGRDKAHRMVKQ